MTIEATTTSRPTDVLAAERAVRDYMAAVGLDVDHPTLLDTPRRVAHAGLDLYSGLGGDPAKALGGGEPIEGVYPGPVSVLEVPYSSICEHHLLPFKGVISVVYLPDRMLAGIGDFDAMIRVLAARPQMQERLADEIADTVATTLDAKGVLVLLTAEHACMWARGERTVGATARSLAARGVYDTDLAARAEARILIGL
ncbi:GTP cyclohydrolase I [Herbiconiux sp. A18JL235]|uniref:GTP cyclohydrolase 1 n=1 Tax=Herbiconiux sp. A18JL235 TaxID=3152363 RepID=A0AB39BD76_9MICO